MTPKEVAQIKRRIIVSEFGFWISLFCALVNAGFYYITHLWATAFCAVFFVVLGFTHSNVIKKLKEEIGEGNK